ncbi:MAG TPA: hypothetical protein DCG28_03170 [Lachnospiraceae bacterium]|nr:hypothetical protein [Lachnospiraceae bacterium]
MNNLFLLARNIQPQDNVSLAISTTLLGMLVVFMVLIIICAVLYIFKFAAYLNEKKAENLKSEVVNNSPETIVKPEAESENNVQITTDYSLIAVITAAIAVQENTSPDKLVIRSIRKSSGWNQEALHEQHTTII